MEKDALKSFGHGLRLGKYNRLNRELSDVVRYISVFFVYLSKHSSKHSGKKKLQVVSLDGPLNHLFWNTKVGESHGLSHRGEENPKGEVKDHFFEHRYVSMKIGEKDSLFCSFCIDT